MTRGLATQVRRDPHWDGAPRRGAGGARIFLIVITLFPLAIGPDAAQPRPIAVPVIWIAAMLACLSGFTRIFSEDVRCGWVDQVALSPCCWRSTACQGRRSLDADGVADADRCAASGDDALSRCRRHGTASALALGTMALTLLGVIGAALCEARAAAAG